MMQTNSRRRCWVCYRHECCLWHRRSQDPLATSWSVVRRTVSVDKCCNGSLRSSLTGRKLSPCPLCGVSQGSVLGLIVRSLYTQLWSSHPKRLCGIIDSELTMDAYARMLSVAVLPCLAFEAFAQHPKVTINRQQCSSSCIHCRQPRWLLRRRSVRRFCKSHALSVDGVERCRLPSLRYWKVDHITPIHCDILHRGYRCLSGYSYRLQLLPSTVSVAPVCRTSKTSASRWLTALVGLRYTLTQAWRHVRPTDTYPARPAEFPCYCSNRLYRFSTWFTVCICPS